MANADNPPPPFGRKQRDLNVRIAMREWSRLADDDTILSAETLQVEKEEAVAAAFREKNSDAGVASGTARLEKAGEDYRNDALDLAKQIRAEKPRLSQADLAMEIVFRWKSEKPCRDSMLVPLISEWERDGKLPPRQAKSKARK